MRFPQQTPIPFREPITWTAGQMGCYGIMNAQQQMIYIGKSRDMRERVTTHVRKQDAADALIFRYAPALVVGMQANSVAEMDAQEKALILAYGTPPANQKVG
jgi:excinuclease UvrABC nuclease subunit